MLNYNMYYKYGTSGFRFHNKHILEIASKIGNAVSILSLKNKKNYGIMITASHNHFEDNGVKILNYEGHMISHDDETFIENYVNSNQDIIEVLINKKVSIFIGYDSRESSPTICDRIKNGCREINNNISIVNYGYVTTPQFHFVMNQKELMYTSCLQKLESYIHDIPCILDCANGVGSVVMEKIWCDDINIKNTEWRKHSLLNNECSSDYVCSYQKFPFEETNELCASLDGDADRIVFYKKINNKFCLLNGDNISALVVCYLNVLLQNRKDISIGFIHTGYTNKACLDYVKSKIPHMKTVCTATGTKHQHAEAIKYDIGIYFEQNGHGNVIFNNDIEQRFLQLKLFKRFFHPCVGDGIMGVFAVLYMLQELKMTAEQWYNLYKNNDSLLLKLNIQNKDIFETTKDQLTLTAPLEMQNFINNVCYEYKDNDARCFVRPSGTENVVRIYTESKDKMSTKCVMKKILWKLLLDYSEYKFMVKDQYFSISHIREDDLTMEYIELLSQLTSVDIDIETERNSCKQLLKCLNENHMIFVLKSLTDDIIVGSGTLLIEQKYIHNFGNVGHIEDIVVSDKFRGYGLGKEIIKYLTNVSNILTCYKCILDCSEENVGFYEKCKYSNKGNFMAIYF